MIVHKDLLKGQTLSFTENGYSSKRDYLIDAVGGTPEAKLYNATITAGVPQYGDAHPILPDVIVTSVSAKPLDSGEQVIVTVNYSVPDIDEAALVEEDGETGVSTVSISTGLVTEQTWRDINGELMYVQWSGQGVSKNSYKRGETQKPQLQVSFDRNESSPPKAAVTSYLGKVNSVPWSGFGAKTWLCTQINATEDKTKGVFKVTYGFSYKPETWRFEAFINLTSEEIEEARIDPDNENGYAIYDVYESADFNSLGLSF
jgi:hypothetical protein